MCVSTGLKQVLLPLFRPLISSLPHFATPLNDIRDLQETLTLYETKHSFYLTAQHIGQSELVLAAAYHFSKVCPLTHLFFALDAALLLARIYLLQRQNAPNSFLKAAFLCFSPFTIFGQGLLNIGTLNDLLFTLQAIAGYSCHLGESALLGAVLSYTDPRTCFLLWPMQVLAARNANQKVFKSLVVQAGLVVAVWACVGSESQVLNAYNILMVNNTTENIGTFWYLNLEMFKTRLAFLKTTMLLVQAFMCVLIAMHLHKTYDALSMAYPAPQPRRRRNLYLNGVLILSLVKLVMNQYPCLDDLSTCAFFVVLNLSFVTKNVGALMLFLCGTACCATNSAFLWVTWLRRFSGNANFFYFQTLATFAFCVLFFI